MFSHRRVDSSPLTVNYLPCCRSSSFDVVREAVSRGFNLAPGASGPTASVKMARERSSEPEFAGVLASPFRPPSAACLPHLSAVFPGSFNYFIRLIRPLLGNSVGLRAQAGWHHGPFSMRPKQYSLIS